MTALDLPAAVMQPAPRIEDRTALDWLRILSGRLVVQRRDVLVPESYYNGDHPLQFATTKFKEAFGNLFGAFANNYCQIIVDAAVERLRIIGFRTGGGNVQADPDAWRIWQLNGMDVESVIAHTEAGKCGTCYLLVDPNEGEPRITVEHPAQFIVATDPGDRRKRLAALKMWQGDDGFLYATVYLPEFVIKLESKSPAVIFGEVVDWTLRPDGIVPNDLGVVPAVPLANMPSLLRGGISDLDPAIPLQNAINKLCTDLMVSSEFGAFRQRVLTGVEIPRDPETGRPLGRSEIVAAMSRLWAFEDPNARVTDLPQTDLRNFVQAIDMFRQDLAAQTRVPPHYLLGQVVNASGDALKVAEAGLVNKCRRKILYFSDPWEEAMTLALRATGREVDEADVEVLWENPERTSLAELVDATVKKNTLGVPLEQLWLELGYTPEQINDMKVLANLPNRPLPPRPTTPVLGPDGLPLATSTEIALTT